MKLKKPFLEAVSISITDFIVLCERKSITLPPFTTSPVRPASAFQPVSRVLNVSPNVSDATRERVQDAIDQLSFIPKAEARARAMKDFARIGVLAPFFTAPAFVQRLRGIAQSLLTTRYELTIFTVESLDHLNHYLATLPLIGHLEGLILLSLRVNDESAKKLKANNLETVLIEYPRQDLNTVEN